MTKRISWTLQELEQLLPKLDKELSKIEAVEEEEVKPLLFMDKQECMDYFFRLMNIAAIRPLTSRECFIHGQLLCVFEMSVMAEALGKKGHYFVIHEDEILERI
jgi:hypothetical protein